MKVIGESEVKDPEKIGKMVLDYMQMKEFVKEPFIISKAEGVKCWDINGKMYYDGLSGVAVVSVGHGNERVIEAMKDQTNKITFAPPLIATTPPAIKLANLISDIMPGDLKTVKLLTSGSESTEAGIKLARQYFNNIGQSKKFKTIAMYYGYQGVTLGALSATGRKIKWAFEPLLTGFVHVFPPYCYRCPYGQEYPGCGITCAKIIRDIIENEEPRTVASVILDPITRAGGVFVPPKEYLPMVRDICNEMEVVLIYDEIVTGFGRTGSMFAAQTFDAIPDILCMGKSMGSGYAPLSGMAFSDKLKSAFWGPAEDEVEFMHGHTYAGNPLSAAAGLAVIQEIIDRKLPENAKVMGQYLMDKLEKLASYGIVGEVRGVGLMVGVELVKDPERKIPFDRNDKIAPKIGGRARKNGLLISYADDWFVIQPPLIVTKEDIDNMTDILFTSVEEVLKNRNIE